MHHIYPRLINIADWLEAAVWPEYRWLSADQQRDTDTASDPTVFHCLTENGQVLHETDNTVNDWSDWGNYRDRSGGKAYHSTPSYCGSK